jgi:hypothetical protein
VSKDTKKRTGADGTVDAIATVLRVIDETIERAESTLSVNVHPRGIHLTLPDGVSSYRLLTLSWAQLEAMTEKLGRRVTIGTMTHDQLARAVGGRR